MGWRRVQPRDPGSLLGQCEAGGGEATPGGVGGNLAQPSLKAKNYLPGEEGWGSAG